MAKNLPPPPPFNLMAPLSDPEMDELESFLLSDAVPEEAMLIDSLDGYLTAIVIGPTSLRLSDWLHGVWGPVENARPTFGTEAQAQRIVQLIMRHMNGIVWSFDHDPDAFEPIINTMTYPGDSHEYLDAEMWTYGFMQGIALCPKDWQPLFDSADAAGMLRPLQLLGGDDLTPAENQLVRTPAQREILAGQVPESVAAIYRYWLPYRKAVHERETATAIQNSSPRVGRNDPCPCGSGKKFKKCCGAASVLH